MQLARIVGADGKPVAAAWIDGLCHEYGPEALQTEAEIEAFLLIMEHFFERIFAGKKRVLFRVLVGPYAGKDAAVKTIRKLKTEMKIDAVLVRG